MSLIFSRACEYALQAMLYLASQPDKKPVLQETISRELRIPLHFLGKVLQALVRNDLVHSQKGKYGGFILGKPAREITLRDIIKAIDGPLALDGCVLGFPECSDTTPCPVHSQWFEVRQNLIQMLESKDIELLSRELDDKLDFIKKMSSDLRNPGK